MKGKGHNKFRGRWATVLAIIVALAMVLSIASPLISAIAYGGEMTTAVVTTQINNSSGVSTTIVADEEIENNKFEIQAQIGFDSNYIVMENVPFNFTIKNYGEDFKGQVEVKTYLSENEYRNNKSYVNYYMPIELEENSSKEIEFEANIGIIQNAVNFSIKDNNDNVVYSKNLNVTGNSYESFWIGVLSENPENVAYLENIYKEYEEYYEVEFYKTINLDENNFPKTESAMENFRILVIDDFDTSLLSDQQIESLKQWINKGGFLILGTGENSDKVLDGISDFISVSTAEKNSDYLSQNLGKGVICIHDFAMAESGAKYSVDELKGIYEAMAYNAYEIDGSYFDNSNADYLENEAQRMAPVKQSTMYMTLVLIGVYILLVGPIAYIMLKKSDKREKGWVVIPLLAIGATALVYIVGMGSYYRDSIVRTASLIEVEEGSSIGEVSSALGVSTGKKGELEFSLENKENLEISSWGNNNNYTSGEIEVASVLIEDNTIGYENSTSWNTKVFEMNKTIDLAGSIDSNITYKDNAFVGTITNNTKYDLEDIILSFADRVMMIEECEAGATVDISFNMSYETGEYYNIYDGLQEVFQVNDDSLGIEEYFENYGRARNVRSVKNSNMYDGGLSIELFAFNEDEIIDGDKMVNGKVAKEQNENMIHMVIPVKLDGDGEEIEIPFGVIEPILIKDSFGDKLNFSSESLYVGHYSEISAVFEIPEDFNLKAFDFRWKIYYGTAEEVKILNIKTGEKENLSTVDKLNVDNYMNDLRQIEIFMEIGEDTEINCPEITIAGGVK